MGSLRGIDSYGQDMYYETKGGIWMPKVEKQTKSVAKTTTKALVPLTKQQPPLPSMQEVINRQYGRPIVDLGFNYTDLSAQQAKLAAPNEQKLLGFTPKVTEAPVANGQKLIGFTPKTAEAPVANGQKLIGFTPKAAEAPVANGQKLIGFTPKAPVNTAITVTPQSAKIKNSAVFPSANAAEYGKMLAENPINWNPALVPTKGNAAQAPVTKAEAAATETKKTAGEAKKPAVGEGANKKPASKAQSRYSNAVIQEKVDAYRKAMEKQGLKGKQLEEQVARYKEGLLADRKKHFNKLKGQLKAKNIAKERAQGKLKVKPKKTGAFSKISKFFKGKNGKVAAAALGIAALGAGLYALLGGKDKKVEETPNIDDTNAVILPEGNEEEAADEAVEETPDATVVPEENEEETPAEPEFDTFKAIPGSWQWRFAERELLLEHQGELDYKPTPAEIRKRSDEIVARDGRKMAADDIHTDPLLMTGDDVTIKKELADLFKEARQQLIEEHKDQKGYEPTWKEMTRIVDAKIKEAKEAKKEQEAQQAA